MRMAWLIAVVGVVISSVARGVDGPEPLYGLLPHDTLAFLELDPGAIAPGEGAAGGGKETGGFIEMGLQALQTAGVLDGRAGEVADALALAGEVGAHRCCIAWLDADLAVKGGGPASDLAREQPPARLEWRSAQVVCILEMDDPGAMKEMSGGAGGRLARLLGHFASRATVRQSIRVSAESKKEYVEFHDTRWPAWLTLAWMQEAGSGPSRARLVLALGSGAMDHYLAGRPVGDAPWERLIAQEEAAAGGAGQGGRGPWAVLGRCYLGVREFRVRFPDAVRLTRLGRVLASLELGGTDCAMLTARVREGGGPAAGARGPRAISVASAALGSGAGEGEGGGFSMTRWTADLPVGAALRKAVPADAGAWLVLNLRWEDLYRRAMAVGDAVLTDPGDLPVEKRIDAFAAQLGVDIHKDLLDRLQPLVLVHDWPGHPLHLPLMATFVGAVEPGRQAEARSATARLTAAAAAAQDGKASAALAPEAEGALPAGHAAEALPGDFTRLRIRTDKDGIAYLQFGLAGPAWGWFDNRLVVSWSPAAVRANAAAASRVPSSAFTEGAAH
jgi:hypothetical protein